MILQSLKDYYDRKAGDPSEALAPEGWELKEIPFVIVIGRDGSLIQIDDLREGEGRARRAKSQFVPASVKRAVNISANLLWDSVEYALGVDARGNPQRVAKQHAAFRERLRQTFGERPADDGIVVLVRFLDRCDETLLSASGAWEEAKSKNAFVSFRLQGDADLVCRRPGVRAVIDAQPRGEADGLCLVSGDRDKVARLHPAIKGIRGGQPTGTNIVSFTCPPLSRMARSRGRTLQWVRPQRRRTRLRSTTFFPETRGRRWALATPPSSFGQRKPAAPQSKTRSQPGSIREGTILMRPGSG